MYLTIRTKIFLTLFIVSLIMVLISSFTINIFLGEIARDEITDNLQSGKLAYERFIDLRYDLLISKARSISQTPHLKAVMNIFDVDHKTVYFTAQELYEVNDLDLMLLIDMHGRMLVDVVDSSFYYFDMKTFPGVTDGLNGLEYHGIQPYRKNLYQIAITPILLENQLLGLLIIGDRFDTAVNEIRDFTGRDVLILYSNKLISQSWDTSQSPIIRQTEIKSFLNQLENIQLPTDKTSLLFEGIWGEKECLSTAIPFGNEEGYTVLFRVMEEVDRGVEILRFFVFGAGIVAIFLAVFYGLWLSKKVSQPILKLRDAAKQLGSGKLENKVEVRSKDELGQLSEAFNNMAMDILSTRRELETERDNINNILSSMIDMLIVLNPDGTIRTVNPATLDSLGYTEEELIGCSINKVFGSLAGDQKKDFSEDIWDLLKNNRFIRDVEGILITKDEKKIPVLFSESILSEEKSTVQGIVFVAKDIAKRKKAEELLRNSQKQLQALSSHLQRLQEKERTKISREIHDQLGQSLTGIIMDLAWLKDELPKKYKPMVDDLIELTESIMDSVRRILTELRPGILDDLGLIAAIDWQVEEFQKRSEIECELKIETEDISINRDQSTAIFRILQEALTNIIRHAEATKVIISVGLKDNILELKIIDNGKGIQIDQIDDRKSFGIVGMKERLLQWNGNFDITKVNESGTQLKVRLPLHNQEILTDD